MIPRIKLGALLLALFFLLALTIQTGAQNPGGISTAPSYWIVGGVRQGASTAASASAIPYNTQAMTVFAVFIPNNANDTQAAVSFGITNDLVLYSGILCTFNTGGSAGNSYATQFLYQHRANLLGFVSSSTSTRYDINGASVTSSTLSAISGTGASLWSAAGTSSFNYQGAQTELILFNSVLSNSDITSVESYLTAKYSLPALPPATTNLIVYEGNSLMYSVFSGLNADIPTQTASQLSLSGFGFINLAIPGTTTTQVAAREAGVASALSARSYTNKIVVVWEITNDIQINNVSGATAYANIKALCLYYKSLGAKVVLMDCMNRADFTTGNVTAQGIVNATLAADFASPTPPPYADALVRVSVAPQLASTSNTTYYNADGVHLTNAGDGVVSSLVATAINNLRAAGGTKRRLQ